MTVLALTAGYGVLPIQGAEISVQVTNDSSSAPEEYVVGVEESALAAALDGQEVDMTITSFKNAGLVAGTIEDGVTNGLAIGEDSYVKNDGGLAIGNGAKAGNERTAQTDTATHATAIGTDSKAASDNSTAIGYSSNASGKNSIAIGDSIASGENNIAIGHLSELTNFHKDNTAIGAETQINADAGTVVGKGAYVSGDYGTAIGRGSDSWSDNSVALGSYAKVDNDSAYAVALGAGSVASEADTVSVGVSEKDADNEHAVKTRRIVNVKDGRFEEGSTDAVTAGQLYDAGIVPGKAADGSVAIGNGSNVTNMNGVAIGDNALVNYSAENGVAIGQGAEVRTDNATAIGQGSRVVNGDGSVALGQGSMVTATDAKGTDTHGVVSVGFTGTKISEGFTRRLINVSDGVNDSDAATYGQVKDVQANVEELDALAVKYDNTAKNSVTFAGTSGTSLENVSDIVMNVENPINHKAEQHSFQNAGLLPGKVEGTATDGKWNMAIGEGSEIAVDGGTGTNMKFNTAIGNSAGVSQAIVDGEYEDVERSTAIGHAAKVRANNSTAIGDSSNVSKDNGVAVGQKAEVQSATSVAIGQGTKIGSNAENSIAIGTSQMDIALATRLKIVQLSV